MWSTLHLKTAQGLLWWHQPKGTSEMKQVPKPTTDEDLIKQFLDKGGKVSKGKTKPPKPELGLSKNVWGQTLTRDEKAARDGKD